MRSKFKYSKVFILWFLNTDKLVKKTRLRLVFSTCLSVFRNQRKNTYLCLNYYFKPRNRYFLSDDDFEIKSKYYSFILVLSCFESYLGFSGWHYYSFILVLSCFEWYLGFSGGHYYSFIVVSSCFTHILGFQEDIILSDDNFEIKSKYYSFIIVSSCFESSLGFSGGFYSSEYVLFYTLYRTYISLSIYLNCSL